MKQKLSHIYVTQFINLHFSYYMSKGNAGKPVASSSSHSLSHSHSRTLAPERTSSTQVPPRQWPLMRELLVPVLSGGDVFHMIKKIITFHMPAVFTRLKAQISISIPPKNGERKTTYTCSPWSHKLWILNAGRKQFAKNICKEHLRRVRGEQDLDD